MHMSSTRLVGMIVLVGMCLGGISACSGVLTNTPVSKTADGWVVTLGEVKEGPDEYVGPEVSMFAAKGEKFIWTLVTVKNELGQEQTFSYETCTLDGKGQARPPMVVDRNLDVAAAGDLSEAFEPGQERTRRLIYPFSKEQRPTRVKCGAIVLPIPGPR
jgi:hypothetical protein